MEIDLDFVLTVAIESYFWYCVLSLYQRMKQNSNSVVNLSSE